MRQLHTFRRYVLTGLAIWLPVVVTFYLFRLFFVLADDLLGRYVNWFVRRLCGYAVPGVGFVAAFLLLLWTGYVGNHLFGRRFVGMLERRFGNLPLIRYIYPPAKQMAELLFNADKRGAFRKMVLVRYPSSEIYSLGFVTNVTLPALETHVGQRLVSVLVPHTPSPLTGYLLIVPMANVIPVDISVEEGIALIVSGGVVGPGKELPGSTPPE